MSIQPAHKTKIAEELKLQNSLSCTTLRILEDFLRDGNGDATCFDVITQILLHCIYYCVFLCTDSFPNIS